jgi:hypothetical protein
MVAGILVVDGSLVLAIELTKQRSFHQHQLGWGFDHFTPSNALSKIHVVIIFHQS